MYSILQNNKVGEKAGITKGGGGIAKIPPPEIENFQNTPP